MKTLKLTEHETLFIIDNALNKLYNDNNRKLKDIFLGDVERRVIIEERDMAGIIMNKLQNQL